VEWFARFFLCQTEIRGKRAGELRDRERVCVRQSLAAKRKIALAIKLTENKHVMEISD
jgi:hypothetical protein